MVHWLRRWLRSDWPIPPHPWPPLARPATTPHEGHPHGTSCIVLRRNYLQTRSRRVTCSRGLAFGGQHLERHLAAQAQVLRAIHLAHAAGAERRDDLVGAQAGAGGEWHRRNLLDWRVRRPACVHRSRGRRLVAGSKSTPVPSCPLLTTRRSPARGGNRKRGIA